MHYALSYKAHIRYHTALFCHLSGRAWVTFGDSPLTTAHWLPFFCRYFFNAEWVRRSSCAPLIAVFIVSQIHFGFQPSKLRNEAGEPPKLSQTNSRQTRTHRNILAPTDRWGCQKLPGGEFWVLLTGPRPKVWVQLITWGGVRWIGGAGDSLWTAPPPRAARWLKPWTEQQEDLRLMGAMCDDVTIFSYHSARRQHVSEPCDRHRARHRH